MRMGTRAGGLIFVRIAASRIPITCFDWWRFEWEIRRIFGMIYNIFGSFWHPRIRVFDMFLYVTCQNSWCQKIRSFFTEHYFGRTGRRAAQWYFGAFSYSFRTCGRVANCWINAQSWEAKYLRMMSRGYSWQCNINWIRERTDAEMEIQYCAPQC